MTHTRTGSRRVLTALGPAVERTGTVWTLDLTSLPIFTGLSVMSRALGDLVIEQTRADVVDIAVDRAVSRNESPELLDVLGITRIKIASEHALVSGLLDDAERLQDHLRIVFGTLQRQRYREALMPRDGDPPRALVFQFGAEMGTAPYRAVLEALRSPKADAHRYLRLTIDRHGRRSHRAAPPHIVVRDLDSRTFIAGSTRIAQTWRDAIVREAERGRRLVVERNQARSHAFHQLTRAGLEGLQEISITWPELFLSQLVESEPAALDGFLKHVLLALEDRQVRALLEAGETLRVVSGELSAYLDRSQLGRVLNVSLGAPRARLDLQSFLERMPATAREASAAGQPLRGVKVLLIHHMTAEVVGLIAALRALGCRDLVTLFISYGGEAPSSLLGPVLALPPDEFRCLSLTNVPEPGRVEGHYRLSHRYSAIEERDAWTSALADRCGHFEDAMRSVAVGEFFRLLERAADAGAECLLIEDGGYLGPLLNDAALDGRRTVADLLSVLGHVSDDHRCVAQALAGTFIGSVEHTRNGHDRIASVEANHGRLAFPAMSIAVSDLKTGGEAREVATSIVHALETVLHAQGQVLARRNCLVLGSAGVIGGWLMETLQHRLASPASQLAGVDLKAGDGVTSRGATETRRYADLPVEFRRRIDCVIGVTGVSVLTQSDVEEWLLGGESTQLILASGSTKTAEFTAIAAWIDRMLRDPAREIHGARVHIDRHEVVDAHTGRPFGDRYHFTVVPRDGTAREHDIICLANLTPINFLFYGVPNEIIDDVMAQLLRCTAILARQHPTLPPRLLAVDRQITSDGVLLGHEWGQTPVMGRLNPLSRSVTGV